MGRGVKSSGWKVTEHYGALQDGKGTGAIQIKGPMSCVFTKARTGSAATPSVVRVTPCPARAVLFLGGPDPWMEAVVIVLGLCSDSCVSLKFP